MRADLLAPMPGIRIETVFRDKDGVVVRAAGSGSRQCPDCGTASASCKGNIRSPVAGPSEESMDSADLRIPFETIWQPPGMQDPLTGRCGLAGVVSWRRFD